MKNYAIPKGINRHISSLEFIDNLLFSNDSHDNFQLTTDSENLASYVKGKTGEHASIVSVKSKDEQYELWIVRSGECQSKHTWIVKDSKYSKRNQHIGD